MATKAPRQLIRYSRLNPSKQEFRLLELQPAHNGNPDDQVVCRLVTVRLTEDLEYLALSSLYGDQSETERILVNGVPITITSHLAQALKHVRTVFFPTLTKRPAREPRRPDNKRAPRWLTHLLRHVSSILPDPDADGAGETPPLRLWIDALCINHQDDSEQSNQFLGMAQIYGSAKMVIGWLGLKTEYSDAGLACLKDIDEKMPVNWGEPADREAHPEDYAPRHEWAKQIAWTWQESADGSDFHQARHWIGANDFWNRPYFQRRWILEEIALARFPTFLLGDSIVSWKQVLRLNQALEEFRETESDVFPRHVKHQLAELPLGTVHALLDEFLRRKKMEVESDNTRSSKDTRSSAPSG
ncbi:heterokaryon incompatibility protein [Pseudomassariella vexata]|uniref:Heterokaryon incompatibility protein n=1 Tax=Pseudomassariella vexata TaxID=1141098 RepID=A0A1Y2DKV2_9PEZI|nr:heterokaryon incompatibility protein [Pseudomassariella vexata]ORY59756.1 heterokaryon incompatibility protein [Pseudomassariella vexata]